MAVKFRNVEISREDFADDDKFLELCQELDIPIEDLPLSTVLVLDVEDACVS